MTGVSQFWAIGDRAVETTTSTGTTITLAGAVAGYRTIASVVTANNQRFPYVIVGGSEWEVGYGTRTGATTFTRAAADVVASSTGGLVTFSAGVKEVWVDVPADMTTMMMNCRADNLIVNGAMAVSQEYGQNAQTGVSGAGKYICDQFALNTAGAVVCTTQMAGGGPPGVPFNARVTVTTADAAIAAGDFCRIAHSVEGFRFAPASFGGANADPISLAFWAQASRSGIYTGGLNNGATDRSFTYEYTTVANNWQYFKIPILPDTTGTWATDFNIGLILWWNLAVGSTYTQTAGSWQAGFKTGTANQVNGTAAINDFLWITGVSLVTGSVSVPIQMAPQMMPSFDQARIMCERQFQKSFAYATTPAQNVGINTGEYFFSATGAGPAAQRSNTYPFRTRMRTAPTMTLYNPAATNAQVRDETAGADCSGSSATGYEGGFHIATTTNAATAANFVLGAHWKADCRF